MGSNLSGPLFFFLSDLKKKTKEKEEALLDLALKLHRQVNLFIYLFFLQMLYQGTTFISL